MGSKKSFAADMPAELFLSPEPERDSRTFSRFREPKSRRVQLLMQPSLHSKLKEKAEENGQSFNDYVHSLLEKAVKE